MCLYAVQKRATFLMTIRKLDYNRPTGNCKLKSQLLYSRNITILRSQLPLRNEFYPEVPPPEEGEALVCLMTMYNTPPLNTNCYFS